METFSFRRFIPLSLGGLLFSRARFCFTGHGYSGRLSLICQVRFLRFFLHRSGRGPGEPAQALALLAGGLQSAVPRGKDVLLTPGQLVGWGSRNRWRCEPPSMEHGRRAAGEANTRFNFEFVVFQTHATFPFCVGFGGKLRTWTFGRFFLQTAAATIRAATIIWLPTAMFPNQRVCVWFFATCS